MSRSSGKKEGQGMGIDQIRETMSKKREAHYASRNAGANNDDRGDLRNHLLRHSWIKIGSSTIYRPMKNGTSNTTQ